MNSGDASVGLQMPSQGSLGFRACKEIQKPRYVELM